MPRSPSIVPDAADRDVYLVLDDFGRLGRSWREIDEERADRETVTRTLWTGKYSDPVRIVAFNTAEDGHGMSRRTLPAGARCWHGHPDAAKVRIRCLDIDDRRSGGLRY